MQTRTSLYEHQARAVKQLKTGSVLCGGVGSGKSRTALEYYHSLPPWHSLYIITTARKRDSQDWIEEANLYSFTTPVVDSWNNIKKYVHVKGAFFIFDEQRVIGSGKWVKVFLTIVKNNDWILLTATPGDSWMDYIPLFVANGFFKNRTEFMMKHVRFKRFANYPIIDSYIDEERLEILKSSILVYMDYKKPAKSNYSDMLVDYDEAQLSSLLKKRKNPYTGLPIRTKSELLIAARKIINSSSSRLGTVLYLLEKHRRLVVFYNFDYELEILRSLDKMVVIGEWNGHKHEEIPKGENWIYLVQYMAGNEAWNCVETNAMVFYSLNYSYRIMHQSAGRIDRLNTPYSNLYYYRLVSKSQIDSAILDALKKKKNFNESRFAKETWTIIEEG